MHDKPCFYDCPYVPASRRRQLGYGLFIVIIIVATAYLSYAYIFEFWWSHDDTALLQIAARYSPGDYLLSPQGFQSINKVYFTPILTLIWDMNDALFGQQAIDYFTVQFVALCGLLITTFIFLRLWTTTAWSLYGVIVFTLTAPTAVAASQLMNIHYILGLLFSTLSASLFVCAIRSARPLVPIMLGAVLYFLASLSKELYVPLVGMLLFIPCGTFRQRLRLLIPYFLVAVLYAFLRALYLPQFIYLLGPTPEINTLLSLPWRVLTYNFGRTFAGLIASASFTLMIFYVFLRHTNKRGFVALVLLGLAAPLLAVANASMADRFHLFTAWAISASLTLFLASTEYQSVQTRRIILATSTLLLFTIFTNHLAVVKRLKTENQRFATVGRFIMQNNADIALYLPGNYLRASDVQKVKKMWGRGNSPKIYYDLRLMKNSDIKATDSYFYAPGSMRMVNDKTALKNLVSRWKQSIVNKPMRVYLRKQGDNIKWNFGPYELNRYSVINLTTNFVFSGLAPTGQYNGYITAMKFVVKYSSPEGWVSYSAPLSWRDEEGETLQWSRKAPDKS